MPVGQVEGDLRRWFSLAVRAMVLGIQAGARNPKVVGVAATVQADNA